MMEIAWLAAKELPKAILIDRPYFLKICGYILWPTICYGHTPIRGVWPIFF